MRIVLMFILFICASPIFSQIDGMKTEYTGRKAFKKERRENILKFNAENGVTSRNLNKLNFEAYQRQQHTEKETGNAYGVLNGNWTVYPLLQSNTGMGRVECVAFHPTNPNIYYVGAAGGGVWKTTNGGSSYVPLTDDLPCGGIASIVVHPTDPNLLYILTGAGKSGQSNTSIGVFKSTDGGTTWLPTGLQDSITTNNVELIAYKMVMKPDDANTLYVCTNLGLFKSINGAATWTKIKEGSIWDIEFKPGIANTIYITQFGLDFFYYCTDGGVSESSWIATASFNESGPYPLTISSYRAMTLAVSPSAPNEVAAVLTVSRPNNRPNTALYNSYIYNSSQSTYTTTNLPTLVRSTCGTVQDTCWASGGGREYAELYVSSTSMGSAIVGGVDFFVRENYGPWNVTSRNCANQAQLFHVDASMIAKNNGEIYVCTDGGIYKQTESYTAGGTWTDVTASMEIAQAYAIDGSPQDENIIMLGLQDNGVHRRTSASYTEFIGGDGTAVAVDQTNPNIFYGTIQNGEFFRKSVNGTETGMRVPGPSCMCPDSALYSGFFEFSKCLQIDKNDPMKLYYMKRDMYYSANRGNNWTRIVTGFTDPVKMVRVAKSNNNYWYLVNGANQLLRTSTFGTNFNLLSPPVSPTVISDIYVSDANALQIYISALGNVADKKLYISNDGGNTWTNLSAGLPNVGIQCIAKDENTGDLYVGTDIGVYVRPNNVNQWISFNNFLPITQVYDLYINPGFANIYANLFGRGVATSPLFSYINCVSYKESIGGSINYRHNLSALDSIKATSVILGTSQANVRFSAQDGYIRLAPGFEAQTNANFSAAIEDCGGTIGTTFKATDKNKSNHSEATSKDENTTNTVKHVLPPPKKE